MPEKKSQKHEDNLKYISEILANKPVTADRIRQALEYSANNLVGAKIVFPDLPVPAEMEFSKEHGNNCVIEKPETWTEEEFYDLDYDNLIELYY